MRLVIDPGHGGEDAGATAHGIIERDFNLRLAWELEDAIDWLPWHSAISAVTVTRAEDEHGMTLRQRGGFSKKAKADLVLSLHCNASSSSRSRGLMAFHWPGNSKGTMVAETIQRCAPAALASRSKMRPYSATEKDWTRVRNVLRFHRATAVLVEVGFLTSPVDAEALRLDSVRRELVACLLRGVAHATGLWP